MIIIKKPMKLESGIVISTNMDKTIIVKKLIKTKHFLYKKLITSYIKFYVHDENNIACIGEKVFFQKSIPLSKKKHWLLIKIIKNI